LGLRAPQAVDGAGQEELAGQLRPAAGQEETWPGAVAPEHLNAVLKLLSNLIPDQAGSRF